jgi:hypothetical protein
MRLSTTFLVSVINVTFDFTSTTCLARPILSRLPLHPMDKRSQLQTLRQPQQGIWERHSFIENEKDMKNYIHTYIHTTHALSPKG